jgi:hypothetical protein
MVAELGTLLSHHALPGGLLAYDASADEVQAAVRTIDPSNAVEVSGGPSLNGKGEPEGSQWTYAISFPEQSGVPPLAAHAFGHTFTCEELEKEQLVPVGGCGSEGGKLFQPLSGGAKSEPELVVSGSGRPDGEVVVEAQDLGDAATSETACVKATHAATGNFLDAACSEEVAKGSGGFEVVRTPVTITDRLPAGLSVVSVEGIAGEEAGKEIAPVTCKIAGSGKEVSCVFEGRLPAYEQIELLLSVRIDPGAKSGEENAATVSGGGANQARSASHPVMIDGVERFGVESWSLTPESFGGGVDTAAGSHPFQVTSVVTANTAPTSALPGSEGKAAVVSLAKDYVAELPAGFVGNPTPFTQCTDTQFQHTIEVSARGEKIAVNECPVGSVVGMASVRFSSPGGGVPDVSNAVPIFNLVPNRGEPARFGFNVLGFLPVFLNASVRAGSDYGVTISSHNIIQVSSLLNVKLTFWGVPGSKLHDAQRGWECLEEYGSCPSSTATAPPPFLIMPTSCERPFESTLLSDSWAAPGKPAETGEPVSYTLPERVDGCNHMPFEPGIEAKADVTDASTSTGLTVDVHVPQSAELDTGGLAESSVKDITVALPEGVAVNPSGANGLEACSGNPAPLLSEGKLGSPGDEIGYEGFKELDHAGEPGVQTATFTPQLPESFGTEGEESLLRPGVNFCPDASKIGTVNIKTPLLPNELTGSVYLASQNANPFGSLLALYIVAEDPVSGTVVKLPGEVSLCHAAGEMIAKMTCRALGQLITTFQNSPQLPFEDAILHFYGGEKAPLTTPSQCRDNAPEHPGEYETTASFVPWSAEANDEENAAIHASSNFKIEHGPYGGPCPGTSLPFSPSLTGGALNVNAGAFSPFTATMSRKDGEQNLQSLEVHLPPGLSGILTGVELCPEPQANLGECAANSLIGETTVSVGVGGDPYTVNGGKFYLTGPYNGSGACTVGTSGCAPFGITFEVPAKAGPFDLERNSQNPAGEDACDCVLVRGKIEINPLTAAITITSNPPGTPDAIPTSIEGIPLEIQHVNAITTRNDFQFNPTNCEKMAVTGTIHSSEGGTDTIGVPFQVTNCAVLKFAPKFAVSTSGKTSRADGASLAVKLTYPNAPFGSQANIAKVKVELPKQLPSRLTTLQKACTAATFDANPATCPAASIVGHAKAITPLIPVALEGPAYFVSHGGEAFPSLVLVLQGYGVTIDLVGSTFINKAGITSSTFKTVPDAPVGSFELTLPEGKYSALAAHGNLCADKLTMPTEFLAQNGAEIHKTTKITVTGCTKHKHKSKKKARRSKARHPTGAGRHRRRK